MTDLTDEALEMCLHYVTRNPHEAAVGRTYVNRKIALLCLDGMDIWEIAAKMGVTTSRIFKALDEMRRFLRFFGYYPMP